MLEPRSPAAPRWFTPITVIAAVSTAIVATTLGAYVVLAGWPPHSSPLWSFAFTAVALLVIAATAERTKNAAVEEIKDHVDLRVSEAAGRMDRRLTFMGNAMIEHGIQLDDNTGEIAKVRNAVEHHSHPVQLSGYDQGYADGAAGRPIAAKMRVIGRQ